MVEVDMSTRIIAFVCGLLVGALLRVTLMRLSKRAGPFRHGFYGGPPPLRCPSVKMPCLFDHDDH